MAYIGTLYIASLSPGALCEIDGLSYMDSKRYIVVGLSLRGLRRRGVVVVDPVSVEIPNTVFQG
jgi:hypothetical protein